MKINIRQQYQYINQKYWFPEQLNFELIIDNYIKEGQHLRVNGKSYIDSVIFFSKLKKTDFSAITTRIKDDASSVDSLHWKKYRKEPLTVKEKTTYKVVDSLGNRYKVDKLMKLFSKLPEGKIGLKYVDVDLTKTLVYNIHEGFRLGTGLYTNKDLLKNFSFGGFLGYGLKDYKWKYGFGAKYIFSEDNDFFVEADYENNIKEIGSYGLPTSKKPFGDFRDFIISKADHIQQYRIRAGFRVLKYLTGKVTLNQAKITPLINYRFDMPEYTNNTYHNTRASINLRYAPHEKLMQGFGDAFINLGTDSPIFTINYTKGFKGWLSGDIAYQKIEGRIEQSVFIKNLGTTSYRLQAGYTDSHLPIGMLFTGEGNYHKNIPYITEYTFQTLQPYEFLSNEYIDLFFTHNFGALLFKDKFLNPDIIIHQNIGWGNLNHASAEVLENFRTKENVFLESGLEFQKILKNKLF